MFDWDRLVKFVFLKVEKIMFFEIYDGWKIIDFLFVNCIDKMIGLSEWIILDIIEMICFLCKI